MHTQAATLLPAILHTAITTQKWFDPMMDKKIKKVTTTSPLLEKATFPIVGIGTSAGGLEALSQFLGNVPPDCGMAFVIIQHLDPTHKCILPELLQRDTRMKVIPAGNRMKVHPNCVYVIPPNSDLAIRKGSLYLSEPLSLRGLRLPIDFFFRSLAVDRGERAIAIILSGMGSDGTLGLHAIKEHDGLVLVQEPSSAQFDSMPRSAIDAGLADIVAPVAELPGRILACLRHLPILPIASEPEGVAQKDDLDNVFTLIRAHSGSDFSLYKKSTVLRRIERRMGIHQLVQISDYVVYLRQNSQELTILFKELLIGVTNFFRDPPAWAVLQEQGLPALLAAHPEGRALRAWVAGCSTGEEAYSLAMLFMEVMEKIKPPAPFSLQIFATDLDADAIDKARQGYYPANIVADVSPTRLGRFFVEDGNGYRINKEIREMVVFAPQNLIMDPPFTKLDILTCRNLLIYFSQELQKKLLPLFHYSLTPGGFLFLGSAETIGGFTDLFLPVDGMTRVYRRVKDPLRAFEVEFPTKHPMGSAKSEDEKMAVLPTNNLEAMVEHTLLQHFCPPAVVVNTEGDILYISGRTGKYLEPAAGKANWNIHVMAREGLRHELISAFTQAALSNEPVLRRNLRIATNGDQQMVNLTVHPLGEAETMRGILLIVFMDVAMSSPLAPVAERRGGRKSIPLANLENSLQQSHEELRIARKENQIAQEELRSANEELQSTNEELQSTNEELTTSKEEMQSLNEELQTVNFELQSKLDELSAANNDMKNLLNSTDIATVFLDNARHVRRFTTHATRIFRLIGTDVGRPLSDIVTDLDYLELETDTQEVLRTLSFSEKHIPTRDGRWFSVRIMPYRTLENRIDGVVITFTDISTVKMLQLKLEAALEGKLSHAR
ncbi:two-component system, chemotaxis family, CheB/CheR fusion protein [Gammaproteobacteria bacterium]